MSRASDERPRYTLMVAPTCKIVEVLDEHVPAKEAEGWFVVAREVDLLPFNLPRIVTDDQS